MYTLAGVTAMVNAKRPMPAHPTTIVLGYLFAGAVFVPLILHFFKSRFDWIDIALVAVGGAAASFIPTVGGIASYAAMIGAAGQRPTLPGRRRRRVRRASCIDTAVSVI
jgi:hypothetical protein